MDSAGSSALSATGRVNVKSSREYVGTSFAPLLKFMSTRVGCAFSNASTPPPAGNAMATSAPRAIQPRRAIGPLRLVRLRVGAAAAQGSVSCIDVGSDNGARGLSHDRRVLDYDADLRAWHSAQSHMALSIVKV